MTASGFDRSSYLTIGSRERDVGRAVVADEDVVLPFRRVSSGLERRILTSEHMTIHGWTTWASSLTTSRPRLSFSSSSDSSCRARVRRRSLGGPHRGASRAYGRGSR